MTGTVLPTSQCIQGVPLHGVGAGFSQNMPYSEEPVIAYNTFLIHKKGSMSWRNR